MRFKYLEIFILLLRFNIEVGKWKNGPKTTEHKKYNKNSFFKLASFFGSL